MDIIAYIFMQYNKVKLFQDFEKKKIQILKLRNGKIISEQQKKDKG